MLFNALIGLSLLVLLGVGVAALFLAGPDQDSATAEKLDDEDDFTS